MAEMTRSARVSALAPEFEDFLFAPIGEDMNGMLLSVVSALARLNIDPWQEAANLAQLPRTTATRRLAALIAALLRSAVDASRPRDDRGWPDRSPAAPGRLPCQAGRGVDRFPGPHGDAVPAIPRRGARRDDRRAWRSYHRGKPAIVGGSTKPKRRPSARASRHRRCRPPASNVHRAWPRGDTNDDRRCKIHRGPTEPAEQTKPKNRWPRPRTTSKPACRMRRPGEPPPLPPGREAAFSAADSAGDRSHCAAFPCKRINRVVRNLDLLNGVVYPVIDRFSKVPVFARRRIA